MVNLRIKEKYHLWFRLTLAFFLIQNLVRTLLAVQKLPGFLDLILIYSHGFIWDLIFWSFLSLPFLFYSNIVHSKFHPNPFLFRFECGLFFLCVFFMTFIGSGELFFWNEFKSRFNFIAVDYLIYTNEVLNNIKESYPMDLILLSVLAISLLIGLSIYFIKLLNWTKKSFLNKKNTFALLGIFTPLFLFTGVAPLVDKYDNDFREDQLSRNGYIELVRAYFSNQISYKNFYANLPDQKVNSILERKKVLISPSDEFKHLQKPNVVMIVVESLGAKFIAPLGGFTETTPFLNQLSKESIFFENLYATGTRTVRGLEAINLSVPHTPGYAVLKRPNHKNLFSLGNTFKKNGYDTTFLYGGTVFLII